MKRGDVISWRTGRASFGRYHKVVSLDPPTVACGQVVPERALVNIAVRMTERPVDACEKCWPVLSRAAGDKEGSRGANPVSGEQAPAPVADRDPAPSPTIGAGA